MSLYAVWVHGNAAGAQHVGNPPIMQARDGHNVVPWSDIVGFPLNNGMVFRGCNRSGGLFGARVVPQPSTIFHFMIPTPVVTCGMGAKLLRVFVLWQADPNITLHRVEAFDGPLFHPVDFPGSVGGGRDGGGGRADLVPGITSFDVPSTPEILWGVGITVGFGFAADGNIRFTSAGADFDIQA